jgi:putative ABC transport system substrate-binding protein
MTARRTGLVSSHPSQHPGIDRRRFCLTSLAGALATPLVVQGQQSPRIAVVFDSSPLDTMVGLAPSNPNMRAFLDGLHALGYVDGKTITIERRALEGRMDKLPAVISELLDRKVEVILAAGLGVAVATQRISSTIPIVVVDATYEGPDRVVESLARPGGNLTGLSGAGPGIWQKLLELLKEALPHASRIAVLIRASTGWQPERYVPATEAAAKALGLILSWVTAQSLEDVPATLKEIARQRPDALLVMGFSIFFARRREIASFALQRRLPAVSTYREFVDEGALMSYTDPLPERFRRAATYVDKILKGANPATLPIELPTRYELRINLMTAKTLGLKIPPSLLVRADQVIQ